jgi:hypothetical protein
MNLVVTAYGHKNELLTLSPVTTNSTCMLVFLFCKQVEVWTVVDVCACTVDLCWTEVSETYT